MALFNSYISAQNVNELHLKFLVNTHSYITATPLYHSGKIFASDWQGYIYCIDAESGKLIYEKQLYKPPKQGGIARRIPLIKTYFGEPLPYMWNGFAGTGYISDGIWFLSSVGGKEGGLFTNGAPGRLYAIDTSDGSILWETEIGNSTYSGSLATLVCDNDNVYASLCSCEEVASVIYKLLFKPFKLEAVGEVLCYDKFTGKRIWSKKTIGLDNSDNSNSKGAGIWGGVELDNINKSLYVATGNSYGQPVSKSSDAVISLRSENGDPLWIFQAIQNDAWLPLKRDGPDFDFGCTPLLFPCSTSPSHYAVGAGNKDGYFYAINNKSGKLLWKTFCHVNSTPDDGIRSNATYYNGKIYVWSKNKKPKDTMSICCLNAETGEMIWNKITEGTNSMTTGAITNGLYFLGNYSGNIFALDTETGDILWEDKFTKGSIGSSIAIYKDNIYGGLGVPALYEGNPDIYGIFCYGLDYDRSNKAKK